MLPENEYAERNKRINDFMTKAVEATKSSTPLSEIHKENDDKNVSISDMQENMKMLKNYFFNNNNNNNKLSEYRTAYQNPPPSAYHKPPPKPIDYQTLINKGDKKEEEAFLAQVMKTTPWPNIKYTSNTKNWISEYGASFRLPGE